MEYFKMNNGLEIPAIGMGVFMMTPEECEASVLSTLEQGYHLIDTANAYMNERAVGRAMKKSGVPREEIFLTTKIMPCDFGYEQATKAIDETLERLDTDTSYFAENVSKMTEEEHAAIYLNQPHPDYNAQK